MTSPDNAAVDLTSLEIIRRYSLAVRQDSASRGEVVAALRADLAWLERSGRSGTRSRTVVAETPTANPAEPAEPAPPARKTPAKPVTRTASKAPAKTPAKAPAKKTASRRG